MEKQIYLKIGKLILDGYEYAGGYVPNSKTIDARLREIKKGFAILTEDRKFFEQNGY